MNSQGRQAQIPDAEREVGIGAFVTAQPGVGGKIRVLPEDFSVSEVGLLPSRAITGRYTIARVRAFNWENNRLIRAMARELSIGRGRVGFAGTKDKRAISTQFFSFKLTPERLERMNLPGVEVLEVYTAHRPLAVGMLLGNRFAIRLRGLEGWELEALGERVARIKGELEEVGGFPNFFGLQRFGTVRPITHRVGAALVRGDYQAAVMEYVTTVNPLEPEAERQARAELGRSRDWAGVLEDFPVRLTFERTLVHHLAHEPEDYVGALRKLPENLLQMFIHAYQSYLFNRMLTLRLERGLPLNQPVEGDIVLPVDRYGRPDASEPIAVNHLNLPKLTLRCGEGRAWVTGLLFGIKAGYAKGPMGEIEREVIEAEEVSRRDFVIYHLPNISSYGLRRALLCRPVNLQVKTLQANKALPGWSTTTGASGEAVEAPFPLPVEGEEGQTPGHTGDSPETELVVQFDFTLPKGSYATMLLREFMKATSPTAY